MYVFIIVNDLLLKMFDDIHTFNPDFSIILGDFNARSNNWWVGNTQTSESLQILKSFYNDTKVPLIPPISKQ